jgi:abhydrolase domain-containing protein 8
VCAEPEPDLERRSGAADSLPAVVVSGSRLGGIANIGFNADEENEVPDGQTTNAPGSIIDPAFPDLAAGNTASENSTEAANSTASDVTDAGYSRKNRNFEGFLQLAQQEENQRKLSLATTDDGYVVGGGRRRSEGPQLPILFFLHGVGGSADIWAAQLAYFVAKGYTVIAPDMLGHGFSSCPDKVGAYTFTKLFKDVITIFDAYIPDEAKVVIVAHSYGCSFGAALARTRPEKVLALIMIASGGPTPLAPPPHLSRYPRCLLRCIRLLLECRYKKSQQQQLKYNPRGKSIKFSEAFDVPNYVFKYIMLGQIWPEGDAGFHRRIGVPTLLVYGMRDTLVSLVEECEMERTIPRAYLGQFTSALWVDSGSALYRIQMKI